MFVRTYHDRIRMQLTLNHAECQRIVEDLLGVDRRLCGAISLGHAFPTLLALFTVLHEGTDGLAYEKEILEEE